LKGYLKEGAGGNWFLVSGCWLLVAGGRVVGGGERLPYLNPLNFFLTHRAILVFGGEMLVSR